MAYVFHWAAEHELVGYEMNTPAVIGHKLDGYVSQADRGSAIRAKPA
ncbi:hypothetical protein [Paenibacillus marinisediminis]